MAIWDERREGWKPQAEDARNSYDVDYARAIHSASFRRLQGKTQILNLGDSDFYRTRLTHSLEVAQLGRGITRQLTQDSKLVELLPSSSLIQSICLNHDLGHPPFGHGGEVALNYCMREHGGFEANGQSLRILTRLEKFSTSAGSNLTRRALLGILKYPVSYGVARNPKLAPRLMPNTTANAILDRKQSKPPKCYHDAEQDVVDWILRDLSSCDRQMFCKLELPDAGKHRKTLHKSLDCSIMDVADDIAYGVHDLEDAIALKLVTEADFRSAVREADCVKFLDALKQKYPNETGNDVYDRFVGDLFADGGSRKHQISRLVHHFVTHVELYAVDGFDNEILRYRVRIKPESKTFLDALQKLIVDRVIRSPSVQHLEFKGQQMVVSVFEAYATDPASFLPKATFDKFMKDGEDLRVICDHIAGMTDHYLLRIFERLYSPRMGSVFDQL